MSSVGIGNFKPPGYDERVRKEAATAAEPKVERFAPSITMPDGRVLQPAGWMWVLGFAMNGFEWAIKEADSPEFKASYRLWLEENKKNEVEAEIKHLEERITRLKAQL